MEERSDEMGVVDFEGKFFQDIAMSQVISRKTKGKNETSRGEEKERDLSTVNFPSL